MRSLDIYKVEHVSRKWFSDNWGLGQYVRGYPAHIDTCDIKSHRRYIKRCETWLIS